MGAVGAVGIGCGIAMNNSLKKKDKTEAAKLKKKANKSQILMTKMEKIAQGFKDMTQDSGRMDKLFTDFMNDMQTPKKKNNKNAKMHEKKKINLISLQSNVKSIIASFKSLQKHSEDILKTIDKAQDRF